MDDAHTLGLHGGRREGAGRPEGSRRVAQYGDVVRVRLAPELRQRIARAAGERTESDFIRDAIEKALRDERDTDA